MLRSSEALQQAFKIWSTEKASQQIRYVVPSIGYEWNLNYCHMLQVQNIWGSDVMVRDLVCHSKLDIQGGLLGLEEQVLLANSTVKE